MAPFWRRPEPDVWDSFGTNATASLLLNEHHGVFGEPDPEDGIIDNCEVCGFAAGWVQTTSLGPAVEGHATGSTGDSAREWIKRNRLPSVDKRATLST